MKTSHEVGELLNVGHITKRPISKIPEKIKKCLFEFFQTKVLTNKIVCAIMNSTNERRGLKWVKV